MMGSRGISNVVVGGGISRMEFRVSSSLLIGARGFRLSFVGYCWICGCDPHSPV